MIERHFAKSYSEARENFRRSAGASGARLVSYHYPITGFDNEDLYVDVACVGKAFSDRACVVVSGTHGVEGFCGSGCQIGMLEQYCEHYQTSSVFCMFVHALNPYGFSCLRRVTHENIDLNRNFIEFGAGPLPSNEGYAEVYDLINPAMLDQSAIDVLHPDLLHWLETDDKLRRFQAIVFRGQYDYPMGIFFGGNHPAWSASLVPQIVSHIPSSVVSTVLLDIHTGLGGFGAMEVFSEDLDRTPSFSCLQHWLGGYHLSCLGTATSGGYRVEGSMLRGFKAARPTMNWICGALEFGTEPIAKLLQALIADNWLHTLAPDNNVLGPRIRRMMRSQFYPNVPEWRQAVSVQSISVFDRVLHGLSLMGTADATAQPPPK